MYFNDMLTIFTTVAQITEGIYKHLMLNKQLQGSLVSLFPSTHKATFYKNNEQHKKIKIK